MIIDDRWCHQSTSPADARLHHPLENSPMDLLATADPSMSSDARPVLRLLSFVGLPLPWIANNTKQNKFQIFRSPSSFSFIISFSVSSSLSRILNQIRSCKSIHKVSLGSQSSYPISWLLIRYSLTSDHRQAIHDFPSAVWGFEVFVSFMASKPCCLDPGFAAGLQTQLKLIEDTVGTAGCWFSSSTRDQPRWSTFNSNRSDQINDKLSLPYFHYSEISGAC